jgi:SAM-dependent MidA family methyltransferase
VRLELPEPDADAAAHSARLRARICAEIDAQGGWISFARYMELALYEPGLGYYSAGARKFGAAGDFVTAPELGPLFGRCVAGQCADVLRDLGPRAEVLELGAGSGAMAASVLAELEQLDALPARYCILDVSADLRERQRATLAAAVPHLLDRAAWLDRLPEPPLAGVIVANEVLDALPVERFVIRGGEVHSIGVSTESGELRCSVQPARDPLEAAVRHVEADVGTRVPEGYASEISLRLAPWIDALGASLDRGVLLFVDYGLPRREYYAPERSHGTLLCHYRHRFHEDALALVGLQDITAWVDFTAVAEAAVAAGLDVAGYTTQAHFLLGCGIADLLASGSAGADALAQHDLARQARALTLPAEMGERFKAIALAKGYDAPLRGFRVRDLRHAL